MHSPHYCSFLKKKLRKMCNKFILFYILETFFNDNYVQNKFQIYLT